MRRITIWLASTVAALVLLFSYRTSTMGATGTPPAALTPTQDQTPPAGADAKSYDGTVAQTRWGPVQVRVTIAGARITEVVALQVPSGNRRDREINARAVPALRKEVLAVQSADIDTVSGATVTSDGYRQSLQAALDAAHFGRPPRWLVAEPPPIWFVEAVGVGEPRSAQQLVGGAVGVHPANERPVKLAAHPSPHER